MKLVLVINLILILFLNIFTLKVKNPEQTAGDMGGGDSGQFVRRNQPIEHIIIPLMNKLNADYSKWSAPDIKKWRTKELEKDKDLEYWKKRSERFASEAKMLLKQGR